MRANIKKHILIILLVGFFFISSLFLGEANLSFESLFDMTNEVLWSIRFPQALTALLVGGGLAIAGLLMQTYFVNPLAGPFVLGIHSGASLFVALFIIGSSTFPILSEGLIYQWGTKGMGFLGSFCILLLMLTLSKFIKVKAGILIIGLLLSYISSALLNILMSFGEAEKIKSFLLWSMGSFSRVSGSELLFLLIMTLTLLIWAFLISNKLNLLLLGENYSKSLGGSPKKTQLHAILITAIITSLASSYCGPVAFVGIMSPHILKLFYRTNDHKVLIPLCFLFGGGISLVADIISTKIFFVSIPLNSILGLMGAPFLIYFLMKRSRL